MKKVRITVAAAVGLLAICNAFASPPPAAPPISGVVRHLQAPVAGALVIFYNLGDTSLARSRTAADGTFVVPAAPVGIYELIAYKKGYLPALVRLWHQAIPEKVSSVEIALSRQGKRAETASSSAVDVWELRSRVPADVLREISLEEAGETREDASGSGDLAVNRVVAGEVRTLANVSTGESSLSRTAVGVHGGLPNGWKYNLRGDYAAVSADDPAEGDPIATGNAAGFALDVASSAQGRVRLTTRRHSIQFGDDGPASLQSHGVSWSRGGEEGHVESVGARYIEEANLYRATGLGTTFFPLASRTWEVQGRYARPADETPGFALAMTYRHREGSVGPSGVGSQGAFFQTSPDADLQASTSVRLSSRAEIEGGALARYLGGGYRIAPRAVARYDLGHGTVLFVRGLHSVTQAKTGSGTVLPRVTSIEDSLEPAAGQAWAFGIEQRGAQDSSVRFEVSNQRIEEVVRAFFEGDFLTDFDSVYLLDGNTVRQYQASARRRLSDSVAGTVNVRYGEVGGELSSDAAASYGLSESAGRFWSARASVEVLPTGTGIALLVRGVRQDLVSPVLIHGNDSDKLAISIAQDLSIIGVTPFGSACKLLFALESARSSAYSDKDEESPNSRLMGGVALAF
jgi:hypothetical protein